MSLSDHDTPLFGPFPKKISNVISVCLIMHNMCVSSDRVMDGNAYAVYNPSANMEEQESIVQEISTMHPAPAVDGTNVSDNNPGATAQIGLANANNDNVVQRILG